MSRMSENEREPLLVRNNGTISREGDSIYIAHDEGCQPRFAAEFKCRNLGFGHYREDVFYSCQWDWPPFVFVAYRLAAAGYTVTVLLVSVLYFDSTNWGHLPWPVWLTNWSFFLLTAYLLVAATIVVLYATERGRCCQTWSLRSSVYSFLPDSSASAIPANPLPWYIKLEWLLFSVAAPAAFMVTVVFFVALYPQMNHSSNLDFGNATLHLSNSILVVCELCLCAIPVRLLHVVYVMLYGLVYTVFSIIYWSVDHQNVLYPRVLDWNHAGMTSLVITMLAFVGVPFLQLVFFLSYKLRLFIYKLIYGSYSF